MKIITAFSCILFIYSTPKEEIKNNYIESINSLDQYIIECKEDQDLTFESDPNSTIEHGVLSEFQQDVEDLLKNELSNYREEIKSIHSTSRSWTDDNCLSMSKLKMFSILKCKEPANPKEAKELAVFLSQIFDEYEKYQSISKYYYDMSGNFILSYEKFSNTLPMHKLLRINWKESFFSSPNLALNHLNKELGRNHEHIPAFVSVLSSWYLESWNNEFSNNLNDDFKEIINFKENNIVRNIWNEMKNTFLKVHTCLDENSLKKAIVYSLYDMKKIHQINNYGKNSEIENYRTKWEKLKNELSDNQIEIFHDRACLLLKEYISYFQTYFIWNENISTEFMKYFNFEFIKVLIERNK